jgi:hypothetical protein
MLETKCSSYLSTNSFLESKCRSLNVKGTWVSNGCTLLWKYIKEMFLETTTLQDSREANCLTKSVRLVWLSQLAQDFRERSTIDQIKIQLLKPALYLLQVSLPSTSHGECLMAKGKKKKKPMKVKSEEEEEDENDLAFDKLSKKDMIKIKNLFERLQE